MVSRGRRRGVGWVVWALAAGCGVRAGEATPALGTGPARPEVATAANAPGTSAPGARPATEPAATASLAASAGLLGWWRGEGTCLELFANGDFEISVFGSGPKRMIMGAASVAADGEAFTLGLSVARIWRARYTGPCRRVHELGGWDDELTELGVAFKPGAAATLRLQRKGDAQVELCGTSCATLTRDTPVLAGRWRVAGLDAPDRRASGRPEGDLIEIDLSTYMSHVWMVVPGDTFATAYGTAEATFVAADRFRVSFTTDRYADLAEGTVPPLFGAPLAVGATRVLDARRLAGERLEVCDADRRCSVLEREFDAYHHDLN